MIGGITRDGFVLPTYQEVRQELIELFKAAYGADIDISSGSVIEELINIFSLREVNLWEVLQWCDMSRDPGSAEGINLDRIAAITLTTRLPATKSVCQCVFFGEDEGTAGEGSIVSSPLTGNTFELLADVDIASGDTVEVYIEIASIAAGTYTVTIDSTDFSYVAAGTETEDEIIDEIVEDVNFESLGITASNVDSELKLIADDNSTTMAVTLTGNLAFTLVGSVGEVTCTETGAKTAPSLSITAIDSQTGSSGWESVKNYEAAQLGRETETDDELRIRMRDAVGAQGAGTDEAIAARLRQYVDGVSYAYVVSNRTAAEDGDGRPAKSFEVIVEGGDEDEICEAIWNLMPSGIEPYGLEGPVEVLDSQGFSQEIYYTRPTTIYVWINLEIELYDEEVFPGTGSSQIKDAIVAWAASEYSVGKDVIRQRLAIPVYSIPGVGEITIEIATSEDPEFEPDPYGTDDIAISSRERAEITYERITVTTV